MPGDADEPPRRTVLRAVAGLVTAGALAGCIDSSSGDPEDGAAATPTSIDDTPVSDIDAPDLDLEEANVVEVSSEDEDGAYDFDVALHHDDDGEDGYANWWQVERLDGTRLGRRELLHAHSEQPFTRSATIDVPDGVTCVVVRGHDQTHGYGGRAVVVDLETGGTRGIKQGSEPRSFSEDDCP